MRDKTVYPVLLITGRVGEGKTTLLKGIVAYLAEKGLIPGGILSEGNWDNNRRDQIYSADLKGGNKILFCQRTCIPGWEKVGNFYLNPAFREFAAEALGETNCDFFAIDEIGKFELEEKGWFVPLKKLLNETSKPMIWVVRDVFADAVSEKMSVIPEKIIHAGTDKNANLNAIISDSLRNLIAEKTRNK